MKALNNLKKWLIKKDLINKEDSIKLSKVTIKDCNIYRNNRIMGTATLEDGGRALKGFKFLRTATSKKPLLIPKITSEQKRMIRHQNSYSLGDFIATGKISFQS